jgi:hypothetical protein
MTLGEGLFLFAAGFAVVFLPVVLGNVVYHVWWSRRHEGRWWV